MPKGGARVGSGPKPKDVVRKWLGGDAGKRGKASAARPPAVPLPLLPAPKGLCEAQVAVWNELAPHACAARTLTERTAPAFALLCKQVVLEQLMYRDIMADGLTGDKVTLQMDEQGGGLQSVEKKAHALLSQHRQMMQRVEGGFLRFRLSAAGKEEVPVEASQDEWDEFEDGPAVN
jgi:hypothetical protein